MRSIKTYTKINMISLRVLLLIYVLICVLTILFSNSFINYLLVDSKSQSLFPILLFFIMPAFLIVFLGVYVFHFLKASAPNRSINKFQSRLILNFIIIVLLSAIPIFVVTIQMIGGVSRFWPQIKIQQSLSYAKDLSVEVFSLKTAVFENFVKTVNIDERLRNDTLFDSKQNKTGLVALQNFSIGNKTENKTENKTYNDEQFFGNEDYKLKTPPSLNSGFSLRELPRDNNVVRYIDLSIPDIIRVFTFFIDRGFDQNMQQLDAEYSRFAFLDNVFKKNRNPFLLFYMIVFLFPTILITVIISINFTHDITQPVVDLSEATMQVSQGNFAIHILNNPKSELGELVNNFNMMVQNLEKTQTLLLRTEKNSIWQTMAQQLAHEIKNPLTPIKLTAERVLRRYRNDPRTALEILENSMMAVIQEVDSLSTLLDEFKTLSRPIEATKSKTNIKTAIEGIITPYITSYNKVVFDTKSMYADINVIIDGKHITQIINNIVSNSIDAMNGEGKIEIRTDIVYKKQSKFCRLSIADTGKGISNDDMQKVWTPYFTTKESGTGLGLPIVERIVTDYGGGIWFNSAIGVGTTFFVDMPASN
ncbi:MAG: ATP-binding protein [Termitinemataceae bacterium]|nr:MAG: ATP-binding protein [Termitinemataceae bacterium]